MTLFFVIPGRAKRGEGNLPHPMDPLPSAYSLAGDDIS